MKQAHQVSLVLLPFNYLFSFYPSKFVKTFDIIFQSWNRTAWLVSSKNSKIPEKWIWVLWQKMVRMKQLIIPRKENRMSSQWRFKKGQRLVTSTEIMPTMNHAALSSLSLSLLLFSWPLLILEKHSARDIWCFFFTLISGKRCDNNYWFQQKGKMATF